MAAYEKRFFCLRKWRHGRIKDSEQFATFFRKFVGFEDKIMSYSGESRYLLLFPSEGSRCHYKS